MYRIRIYEYAPDVNWLTTGIPIYIAIAIFMANVFYQSYIKRKANKERLANELIGICDRMIRYAVNSELYALDYKYFSKLTQTPSMDNESNRDHHRHYRNLYDDMDLKYEFTRSELKERVMDFNVYWDNKEEKNKILELFKIAGFRVRRDFRFVFDTYSNKKDLDEYYEKLRDEAAEHVLFNGVGFELIRIQRIIDPSSPMLYLRGDLERKMLDKIADETKKDNTHADDKK